MDYNEKSLIIRYLSLMIILIIFIFTDFVNFLSKVFTYTIYYILAPFYSVSIINNNLFLNEYEYTFKIIKECVASSAYLLIFFVFLSIPLKLQKVFSIVLKASLIFTLINIIRIVLLILIYIMYGQVAFDNLHLIFYQGLSAMIVALIIIYYYRKEKTNGKYPFYSDVKYIISHLK